MESARRGTTGRTDEPADSCPRGRRAYDRRAVRELQVSGLRVAYELEGEGPPLVLLHGAVSDARVWRRQIEALAGEFTVVAWDAPGAGRSADPPEGFGLADWADALAELLGALALGPAHVLGLSFGGSLALAHYDRHPSQVTSLILAGAYAGWKGSLPAAECAERLEMALLTSRMEPAELAARWLPSLLSDAVDPQIARDLIAVIEDSHPAGMRLMARALAEADLRHVLPAIRVPTLLLWGERDERSPLAVAEAMRAAIAGARLVVIPRAGHRDEHRAAGALQRRGPRVLPVQTYRSDCSSVDLKQIQHACRVQVHRVILRLRASERQRPILAGGIPDRDTLLIRVAVLQEMADREPHSAWAG